MVPLLFVMGGLVLGFSIILFFASQQISKCSVMDIYVGKKPNGTRIENLMNKVISIDEKISAMGRYMGILLLIMALFLLWIGNNITK